MGSEGVCMPWQNGSIQTPALQRLMPWSLTYLTFQALQAIWQLSQSPPESEQLLPLQQWPYAVCQLWALPCSPAPALGLTRQSLTAIDSKLGETCVQPSKAIEIWLLDAPQLSGCQHHAARRACGQTPFWTQPLTRCLKYRWHCVHFCCNIHPSLPLSLKK